MAKVLPELVPVKLSGDGKATRGAGGKDREIIRCFVSRRDAAGETIALGLHLAGSADATLDIVMPWADWCEIVAAIGIVGDITW